MKQRGVTHILLKTVETHALFAKDDTLVVGYSGGADSTALLHLLHTLPGYRLTLIAAHLNHRLRGNESDLDELSCRETAKKLGVAFESRAVDVQQFARNAGLNLEDAARQARQTFFDEMLIHYGATAVVLAHHADDQTETVLMRLLRGSGMSGLSGIGYRNHKGYLRPLLDIPGQTLREWLSGHGIAWREDASNNDQNFLRNRIRHQLIPLLESYNPALRETINATAEIIAADNSLLHEHALAAYRRICTISPCSAHCNSASLLSLHPALTRRIVRLMYEQAGGTLHGFARSHCEDCITLCRSSAANSSISLPHGIIARKEYDRLVISKTAPDSGTIHETTLSGCGRYLLWDSFSVTVAETTKRAGEHAKPGSATIIVDADAVPFPWKVRTFQPGDRIQPSGMNGHKKIKDLFIDLKIPRPERTAMPLFFARDELFAVGSIRHSTAAAVTGNTVRCISITLQPTHDQKGTSS